MLGVGESAGYRGREREEESVLRYGNSVELLTLAGCSSWWWPAAASPPSPSAKWNLQTIEMKFVHRIWLLSAFKWVARGGRMQRGSGRGRLAHLTASSLGYIVAAVPCHAPNWKKYKSLNKLAAAAHKYLAVKLRFNCPTTTTTKATTRGASQSVRRGQEKK